MSIFHAEIVNVPDPDDEPEVWRVINKLDTAINKLYAKLAELQGAHDRLREAHISLLYRTTGARADASNTTYVHIHEKMDHGQQGSEGSTPTEAV